MFEQISNKEFKMVDEIAYFISEKEPETSIEWAKGLIEGNYTESNFDSIYNSTDPNNKISQVGKEIAKKNCLVLEIGAGPGGGFVPYILKENLNADVIMSDISPTVIREWKRVLSKKIFPKNIKYAEFDICNIPFKNDTIDIVTSIYGFANLIGDQIKGLSEVYRIVKKGGMFINCDICVNEECKETISQEYMEILVKNNFSYIFKDFKQETVDAGFVNIKNKIINSWSNKEDDSELATLCRKIGISITFDTYLRYCYK
jgi:ubiquinone/menaquinone biosynthesis C-methylase UbiE